MDYESVGVNLHEQDLFNVKLAMRMPWLGGHSGAFDVGSDYLVSGCDGIGTKIKLYQDNSDVEGVSIKNLGQDLVAMVFNDIVCSGATPLFMNDYLAVPKIDDIYLELIDGIRDALKGLEGSPPLISGETAIHPDIKTFDIAGFGVGACPKANYIDGKEIVAGNVMLGLRSSGFHANGYTLIRKVWQDRRYLYTDSHPDMLKRLLTPTRIYVNTVLSILREFAPYVKGICHITGGGRDNLLRLLGEDLNLRPNWNNNWTKPEEFKFIQEKGEISDEEMVRVFNDGIGMIMVVDPEKVADIVNRLEKLGEDVIVCGTIMKRLKQTRNETTGRIDSEEVLS
jgi:phosphoribosylformylglycinamidine cyclo-ligase